MKVLRKSLFLAFVLAFFAVASAHAAFPGRNGPIVYTHDADEQYRQVWTAAADGSSPRQLTEGTGSADDPAISPDGKKVVFSWSPASEAPQQIGIVNIDGTGQHLITSFEAPVWWAIQPSFSPDGEWIVFVRLTDDGAFMDIFKMRIDGSDEQRLTDSGQSESSVQWPVFSPDGATVLYIRDGSLWTMNPDGTGQEPLVEDVVAPSRPSYSPDGSKIAFAGSGYDENETFVEGGIYLVNADGSGEVTPITSDWEFMPAFSPDGTRISFTQFPASENQQNLIGPSLQALAPPLPIQNPQVISISSTGDGPRTLLTADTGGSNTNGDWGYAPPLPTKPNPPTQPVVDPPAEPGSCGVRVVRARFFVFKKRNVVRLVARYRSAEPGRVTARFFEIGADGKRGRALGSVRRGFETEGMFRLPKRVKPKRAKALRRATKGFVAQLHVHGEQGACEQTLNLRLNDLRRIDRQFVWFMAK